MLNGTVTSVFGNDINTDDIIPALYLIKSDDPEYDGYKHKELNDASDKTH